MTSIVNNYYPLDYLALVGVDQAQSVDPRNIWASTESLPPAPETLTLSLSSVRPLNCLTFEIIGKPIDFTIQWFDGTNWNDVVDNPEFNNMRGVTYLGGSNPWVFIERHFETISTQQILITFNRLPVSFPFPDSALFPWSVNVRNLRVLYEIDSVNDYQDDTGIDILGNSFRTELYEYNSSNMTDGDTTTYWKSFPHVDPAAVESVYLDLRDIDGNPTVIDEIYIDPITYGPNMHLYYSNDDATTEWDLKLWTPIPRHYILKKGYASLPSSTTLKYLKLEFSNLSPIPYNTSEYPNYPSFTYNRYPSWVQNYFQGVYKGITDPGELVGVMDTVNVDPLGLGFIRPSDSLSNAEPYETFITDTGKELQDFMMGVVAQQEQVPAAQQDLEGMISFKNSFQWGDDLSDQMDQDRALTRLALQMAGTSTPFQSEGGIPELLPPSIQSKPDLSDSQAQKLAPIMWFPMTCRHSYQVVRTNRTDKIAYYVGIKELGVYRNNYNVINDPNSYVEILGDQLNVRENDFLQVDDFWVVGEALLLTHPTFKQSAVGRVRKNRTLNQTAAALIQLGGKSKTQTATAHIQVSRVKTQSAAGRISINKSATQPAKANIAVSGTTTSFLSLTSWSRPTSLATTPPAQQKPFTTLAGLNSLLSSALPGDYIYYNGVGKLSIPFTSSGTNGFVLQNHNPAGSAITIDLGTAASIWNPSIVSPNYVEVAFTGSTVTNGTYCWFMQNCSNLNIYGGSFTGGSNGIRIYGTTHDITWLDGYIHDVPGAGGQMTPNNGDIYNNTIRWEVNGWALDPTLDDHTDKGTGLHALLMESSSSTSKGMHDNTCAIYGHDSLAPGTTNKYGGPFAEGGGGCVIELGRDVAGQSLDNNTLYALGHNLNMHPTVQAGTALINLYGGQPLNGCRIGWAEVTSHSTGPIVHCSSNSGWHNNPQPPITVDHGRSHGGAGVTTNLWTGGGNAAPNNVPYPSGFGLVYHDCT